MLQNLSGKMAAQHSLFELYDSHKNPSQDDLANSKRKRFDEDIIPSDSDSEHDDRMEEDLEGFEVEEISEVEEPASVDVECTEPRDGVEGQKERFDLEEADAPQICAGECCKEIDPVQIKDASVLSRTRKLQGKKWRQFSCEWYKTYPWLVLCGSRLKAFCAYCRSAHKKGVLSEGRRGGGDAFVTEGFSNWKKALEIFLQHSNSSMHKEALLKMKLMQQPTVTAQLSGRIQADQKLHRDMLLKQLTTMRYLLRQGLALRGHEDSEGNLLQLLLLRCEDSPGLKQWIAAKKYISPEIVNELIALMAHHVLRESLHDVQEAEVFSIIVDEATDISNTEQLCLSVRWVDNAFMIHEAPVELIEVPKTDAATLAMMIKDSLIHFSLPLSQCRGQSYDGASNMSGHISGVAARIQKEEESAIYVHCLAHCTNLCLQTIGKQLAPIRDALFLV